MSQPIFHNRLTLLAGICVLGLSACSSNPINDSDSRIGNAADRIGEAGSNLWVKTKHVFRLDGTDAYAPENETVSARAELPQQYKDELDIALVQEDLIAGKPVSERIQVLPTMDSSAIALETGDLETGDLETGDLQIGELEQPLLEQPVIEQAELTLGEPAAPAAPEIIVIEKVTAEEEGTPVPQRRVVLADQSYEVQADENLWDISKRLTGDATNWRDLAALNSLDNNGTVYIGQTLHVPGDMLRQPEQPTLAAALPATDGQSETETTAATKLEAVEAVSEIVVVEATQPELDAGPSTSFKVLAGESLWDMAKRTTGDATNWKTIAAANGMNEKEAALIKYGQTLDIPTALLKEGVTDAPSSATPSATVVALPEKTPATTEASVAEVKSVVAETAEATASATTTNDADAEMTIMPANFQADPPVIEAAQVEPVAAADSEAATTPPGNESVMVSGTYYPKAIYNDANFSATLLMRVSPGTELTVSRAIGPWFEVKTEKGIGYVHSRDIK